MLERCLLPQTKRLPALAAPCSSCCTMRQCPLACPVLDHRFKPDFKLIKKRIEDLIQREYLERDKENPQLFRYLA